MAAKKRSTERTELEADRDRLRDDIETARLAGDLKTSAALQSQLNGVSRMLLRISGESAPSDTNLIRSPQWGRLKAKLFDALSKKHPKAWQEILRIEADESR